MMTWTEYISATGEPMVRIPQPVAVAMVDVIEAARRFRTGRAQEGMKLFEAMDALEKLDG